MPSKEELARIVQIVATDFPEKNIGTFKDVIKSDDRAPGSYLVGTSHGEMRITREAITDLDHHSTVPNYSKVMADSFALYN